jgi:hypothetical protein
MPTVRDACVGLAIGVGLLYLGTRLSSRLFSWPLIGLGVLLVLVMSAYIIALYWERISPPARKVVARAHGHVRTLPQLGTLIRSLEAQSRSNPIEIAPKMGQAAKPLWFSEPPPHAVTSMTPPSRASRSDFDHPMPLSARDR